MRNALGFTHSVGRAALRRPSLIPRATRHATLDVLRSRSLRIRSTTSAQSRVPLHAIAERAFSTEQATEVAGQLREEYPRMFDPSYTPRWELYDSMVRFEDPLNRFRGIQAYRRNIGMLRDSPLFGDGQLVLHDLYEMTPETLVARWTLSLRVRFLPWRPRVVFTGTSEYLLDLGNRRILSHTDRWDSINRQECFSWEGVGDLLGQLTRRPLPFAPDQILYRFREYAVARESAESIVAHSLQGAVPEMTFRARIARDRRIHGCVPRKEEKRAQRDEPVRQVQLMKADVERLP